MQNQYHTLQFNMLATSSDFAERHGDRMTDTPSARPQMDNVFYGWFDDATQDKPTYDPPRDAPCPFCGKPIHREDVRISSLMYVGQYGARSYFFRQHKSCAEKFAPLNMDDFILEMIQRNGD